MKSANEDLYDFEQSDECLRLELSPDNRPQRRSVRLTELKKPSTTCRSKIAFSGPKKRIVATERKGKQVQLNADQKRGSKTGRKRLHSSEDNADVSRGPSKQRTSIRLASSTVTKSDTSRDDSGLVMSPPISTCLSLRSSGRVAICTPSLVSTSTPNTAGVMQTNTGSSDDSCFGFKYLIPSVSLILSPVEASPSSRMTSLVPDDSGISMTPLCDAVRPDTSVPSTGQ